MAQTVKHLPTIRESQVQSLGWEDLLEKEMETCSSTLAWKILWTEEPSRLQSMGVTKSWTRLSDFTFHSPLSFILHKRLVCTPFGFRAWKRGKEVIEDEMRAYKRA